MYHLPTDWQLQCTCLGKSRSYTQDVYGHHTSTAQSKTIDNLHALQSLSPKQRLVSFFLDVVFQILRLVYLLVTEISEFLSPRCDYISVKINTISLLVRHLGSWVHPGW